ncbi:Hypothetical predicted protein [Mytilus galloprovincialis]|uniref:SMB domain-containing protein n=1 Tax=Mytilus galloprovincialis TaxID=29158 RepID=A0A8B6HMI4_MYTGA|nr:Hypothetical predicted protein [Mytilus galloprovincialis]
MKTTQQSYFPILFLLICGVLSWNYVSNTEKTPDGSLNFNQNTVTKIERSYGGATYDQNTVHVKYTERITNVSPNTKKTTAKEKERIPYGSPNSNDDTATKTERIPDASVDSHKNTATQTESIYDGSTNNNKNTNTKIYRTPRGSVDLIQNTATQTERISYGWTNSDKKTDTQTEWTSRSSVNSISNTATQTESIYYDSTNNNKNRNKKTETTIRGSVNIIQNTVQTERISYGSTNSDNNTDTQTEEAPRGSVNSNQNTATQTEKIPDSLKNLDKNTKTRTERTPRGSVNSNQHTATQTERISYGSANHTQHRKRYNQDLFTASWTTVNDGLLLGLNKSKENIPSEIRNTKINDTLNLLSGLSTQSTEHLTTLKELQRDPCQKYGTCSVAQNKTKWYCYCDSDCKMFNDCCSDYNGNIRNSNSQLSFECYPQTYVKRSNSRTGFLAVGSCPNSYKNRTVKERCLQNNFTENGIFVSYGKILIFKNKFCALCNNVTDVQEFDIVFVLNENLYEYMFKMKKEDKMTYFLSNSDFKVIPPGNTNLRFCMKDLISNSNYNICQSYNNPILVFDSFKLYKNYFCRDSNVSSDMYSFVCIYKILDMLLQDSLVFSLSILVSLGNPTGAYTNENKCREWTEEIKQLGFCSQYDIFINASINFRFSLISNQMLRKEIFHQIVLMVGHSYNTKNFTIRTSKFKIWMDENGLIVTIRVEMIIQKSAFHHEIEDIRKHLSKRKVRVILNNGSRDQDIEIFNTYDMPGNGSNTSSISQLELYKTHNFPLESLKTFPSENGIVGINQIDDWRCDEVYIQVQFVGEELHVQKMRCLTTFNLNSQTISGNLISGIITYVSFSVSAIALCVLIIVNRQLNMITSIPISNIENISVSIMLSNILFMVGIGASEKKSAMCYVIGVILHYLLLCVYFLL